MKKLIIAGGSGFLGSVLTTYFRKRFDEIILLSRKQKPPQKNINTLQWDAKNFSGWEAALENADVVINMAGRSVDCRYTQKKQRSDNELTRKQHRNSWQSHLTVLKPT